MEICFYTDGSLFQIYNGSLKKNLHGKYCQQSYTINTDQRRGGCGPAVLGRGRGINKSTRLLRSPPRRRRPPAEPRPRGARRGRRPGTRAALSEERQRAASDTQAVGPGVPLRRPRRFPPWCAPRAARSSRHEKTLRAVRRAPRHPLQTVKNKKINTRPRARVLGSRGCHLSGAASAEAAVGVARAARRALGARGAGAEPSPPAVGYTSRVEQCLALPPPRLTSRTA